jgi:hypothetical protein
MVWTCGTVRANVEMDQSWIDLAAGIPVDAQPLGHAWTKVVEQNVCA